MRGGERGEGRGPKAPKARTADAGDGSDAFEEIEYLLFQSTQGLHFIFTNAELAEILARPILEDDVFTASNMHKVQDLLSKMLDREGLAEKRAYLERLPTEDFELLVRTYFQLVENTILAHNDVRH